MESGATIVIVTFNSEQTIWECLNSVGATVRPCDEVLVIDNNSQDNTAELVQQFLKLSAPNIKFLPQTENLGFSKGCNIGIGHSSKDYIILLNPDTKVFGNWVERLTSHFEFYERTGAVGALSNSVLATQNVATYFPDYVEYIEQGNDLITKLESTFTRKSFPTKILMGFCLALSHKLIKKYGDLDEDIFLGDDDLEISWRLRERGYLLRVALDVYVDHERQVSFSSLPEKDADDIVRDGSDVLFRKMVDYYKPNKVPDPRIYFGIGWWNPRILETMKYEDIFCMNPLPYERKELLLVTKNLAKEGKVDEAIDLLNKSLHIIANDYLLWYILGSMYLTREDYANAKFALKNAWSYEVGDEGRAGNKLKKIYKLTAQSPAELENVTELG